MLLDLPIRLIDSLCCRHVESYHARTQARRYHVYIALLHSFHCLYVLRMLCKSHKYIILGFIVAAVACSDGNYGSATNGNKCSNGNS